MLEAHGPIAFSYYYAMIYQDSQPIGLVYTQFKQIELYKDYRIHAHSDKILEQLKVGVSKFLFRFVRHGMLICGNVVLTGEYGYKLDGKSFDESKLMPAILDLICAYAKRRDGHRVNSILMKDFYTDKAFQRQSFGSQAYYSFQVQPDMIIRIRDDWESYEDYLSEVKSKYRVKFKKIKKKGEALHYTAFDYETARQYDQQMYALYKATADRATFSMFILSPNYFSELKAALGDKLHLYGVFHGDNLIAFYSFVNDGEIGDAHFLGYNVALNSKYQIYFNILLRLVEEAIVTKVKYLNLSRTALEIKSSVGAEPYEMSVHLKYNNALINKVTPFFMSKFVPPTEWLPRSPFK